LEVSKVSEEELDEAYRLGLEQGRKEAKYDPLLEDLPAFEPWTSGAHFEPMRSWFDSLLSYERAVTENLRDAEEARWMLERTHAKLARKTEAAAKDSTPITWPQFTMVRWLRATRLLRIVLGRVLAPDPRSELKDCGREMALVDRAQRLIWNQLHLVRRAVDAELEYGRGYACTVEAIRSPPLRPLGVREFASVGEFVDGDRRRMLMTADGQVGAGGEDYGYRWRLEHPLHRWRTTRWRVSWLSITDMAGEPPTYEVYAIEFPGERSNESGRVWLMGEIQNRKAINAILPELEEHAQGERNSLIVVARQIHDAASAERYRKDPTL
jgi:hypothetical protein